MFTLWEIWEKIHLFRESSTSKRRFCRGKQVNVVERKLIDDSQIVWVGERGKVGHVRDSAFRLRRETWKVCHC